MNNISNIKDNSPKTNLGAIIHYPEIIKIYDQIDEETRLGRTIILKWNMINYEPSIELLAGDNWYRLFDITWFRKRLIIEYKEENGAWTSFEAMPTANTFEPFRKATINGYGDTSILISPTICPGGFCLGGEGEHYGEFNETIIQEINNKNYRIKIVEYPVTKSIYLLINDSSLLNKKLVLGGEFALGDSAITTDLNAFYFPWDKYSFNFIYASYFPSDVILNMKEIEDLNLNTKKEIIFSTSTNETKEVNLKLNRGDIFKEIVWKIILILIPFIFYILRKIKDLRIIRYLMYLALLISIYFALPTPLNISRFNLLNIITSILCTFLIIFLEIKIKLDKRKVKKSNIPNEKEKQKTLGDF
jgi:hypothetical protein